jgi:uncharacterized membrane protein
VRISQALTLAGLVGLIVLGLVWELGLAPTGRGTLALKVLPLLAPVWGLWRRRLYTFRWLSLMVWLYVIEGVLRLSDPAPVPTLAALELLLCAGVFIGCGWQVRARFAAARAAAQPSGTTAPDAPLDAPGPGLRP